MLNQKGFGTISLLIAIGAVTLLAIVGIIQYQNGVLDRQHLEAVQGEAQDSIVTELRSVLDQPQLCKNMLKIQGSSISPGSNGVSGTQTFSLEPQLQVGSKFGALTVQKLTLQSTSAGSNQYFATYTVELSNNKTFSLKGTYTLNSDGQVTDCTISVDPKTSCEKLGATWLAQENRCTLCEKLGGVWSQNKCSISN